MVGIYPFRTADRILNKIGFASGDQSPVFQTNRRNWLASITRDSILAEYTEFLFHGKPGIGGVFDSKRKALKETFAAHANSDNCWDSQSVDSYLRTRVPQNANQETVLRNCASSFWTLMAYFAQWPFNSPSTPKPTSLTLPSFFRAMAFLNGLHSEMFWPIGFSDEDAERNDLLPLEYIFRALSTDPLVERSSSSESEELLITSRQPRDILAVLYSVQPVTDYFTTQMTLDELTPTAISLSPSPAPELPTLAVSNGILISLLDLLISLFEHWSQVYSSTSWLNFKGELEAARTDMQNVNEVSFDIFIDKLGGLHRWNFYHAISY
ncbi:unnamed protein product, partial [Clonostachys solani]